MDESIFGEGKSIAQLDVIFDIAHRRETALLVTRLSPEKYASLDERWGSHIDYCETSQTAFFGRVTAPTAAPRIAIIAAGSSDVRVAREASRTLAFSGFASEAILDVGVAGLWRLTQRVDEIRAFPIVIAVAGMDAALPTVLGGLIPSLIIAVPTSVGYGVAAGGHAALHAILASCAPGIATVNIDNGYGAACAAIKNPANFSTYSTSGDGIMERRNFIMASVAGAAVTASGTGIATAQGGAAPIDANVSLDPRTLPRVTDAGERRGDMWYRTLGHTGEKVSLIGMGGAHLSRKPLTEDDAVKLIHAALDRGINFMDNSWDYGHGNSEKWMGTALAQGGYRKKAFLMTKLDGRTKESAKSQLEESLTRLKTDHIDLVQFHEILRFDDPDRIFTDGGALAALKEAKQAGKVRYIGFTGHKDPRIHLYMLEVARRHGFLFDTVQMPLNVMDAHFRSFSHLVVPELVKENIGILGMKTMGDGVFLKSGAPVTPIECLHYAMNLPTSVVITGIDSDKILDQAFEAAKTFKPMSADQIATLVAKTKPYAMEGKYEFFKTSSHFDTTAKHADWLGDESELVLKLGPPTG